MTNHVDTSEKLKQELFGFQIFFITLSVVIGSGIFTNNGMALAVAGPMGLIIAVLIISIVVLAVNECISELAQQFPVYNSIVEYVRTFVDEDFGWVIGLAYWYAYAATFASQTSMAATLLEYWGLQTAWRVLICYVMVPVILFLLNMTGVFWYGVVETIGGFLKLVMIVAISIYLYTIADDVSSLSFEHGQNFSSNGQAQCYAIPLTAYAFQGLEVYAMTAFEARDGHALRWPARWTAYVAVVVYIMCTLGEVINVKWDNPALPQLHDGVSNSTLSATSNPGSSSSMIVIAALSTNNRSIAGFLNGCLLFSVFSAANSSLYVASRTLWGMAKHFPRSSTKELWVKKKLAILSEGTKVPVVSLLVSLLAFCWVPFLQLVDSSAVQQVVQVISISSSTAIMIVWAAICLAFIRYYYWLKKCEPRLRYHNRPEYIRLSEDYIAKGSLHILQPLQAWIGLIGCITIFAFSSATWWSRTATVTEVAMAYGPHMILFLIFIISKAFSKNKEWVKLKNDEWVLRNALDRLWIRKIDHHEETASERLDSVMKSLFPRLWERFKDSQNSQQADGDIHHRSEGSTSAETNRQELLSISNDQPV
ncbi:amino acid transporter [Aspergillus eucalypticola CBS 122712]|uniref:Amino acid transporter n=1 Tax=Aspergillus eucalypticola (strain CBS 122712 / IBT 29274) TaxID=1448314 RepID=A0A317UR32_ASPEC|nr:amino acid transporter [Aspergillus eucalypticola CBS 122712]PWY64181.1 amino acid transporter [Aspergillus eucalypticola CBS 122712]